MRSIHQSIVNPGLCWIIRSWRATLRWIQMIGVSVLSLYRAFPWVSVSVTWVACFLRVRVEIDIHCVRLCAYVLVSIWQRVEVYMNCRDRRTRLRITRLNQNVRILLGRLWVRPGVVWIWIAIV